MKFLKAFGIGKKSAKGGSKISDYYQETLNKAGREQFKKLIERGLRVPVVVL